MSKAPQCLECAVSHGLSAIPVAVCVLFLAACAAPIAASGDSGVSTAATTTTAASADPSSTSSQTTPQACKSAQIMITLSHTGAVMSESGGFLTFTNTSHTDCSLTGWPSVTGTQSGSTVTFADAHDTMFGAWILTGSAPVTKLGPGQSAYAVAVGGNTPLNGATTCPSVTQLHVSLPGRTAITTISAWLPANGSYLPDCLGDNGKPDVGVSALVPLGSLAH